MVGTTPPIGSPDLVHGNNFYFFCPRSLRKARLVLGLVLGLGAGRPQTRRDI